MWFRKFVLFVIFFWPRISAAEVFVDFVKTSAGEVIEDGSRKRSSPELLSSILSRTASNVENATQSLRRMLKSVRKWCRTHPEEMRLGKCWAKYFNVGLIPGLRRNEFGSNFTGDDVRLEDEKEISFFEETSASPFGGRSIGDNVANFISSLVKAISDEFQSHFAGVAKTFAHYHNIFSSNDLAVCTWHYIVQKFWIWVDTAPTN